MYRERESVHVKLNCLHMFAPSRGPKMLASSCLPFCGVNSEQSWLTVWEVYLCEDEPHQGKLHLVDPKPNAQHISADCGRIVLEIVLAKGFSGKTPSSQAKKGCVWLRVQCVFALSFPRPLLRRIP